ncbi:C-type lectin protein [Aspergillus cavernicola]|uniref:C-type lectin protein n=1 Tax=Aspergillus cavernicola TaxID=176166 RepID=A0ABR4IKN5_9EURO
MFCLSPSELFHTLPKELIYGPGEHAQQGALLDSAIPTAPKILQTQISTQMLEIITAASLSITERNQAGRVLFRLGDPRPLAALADIPGGTFIFGSNSHPNSLPQSVITVNSFRISIYPVINADYALFIHETGRPWLSPDGRDLERRNAPTMDLTWYDARAYCAWLTSRWRGEKKISESEYVRLPTEPEWKRAATGDLNKLENATHSHPGSDSDSQPIYPWGTT